MTYVQLDHGAIRFEATPDRGIEIIVESRESRARFYHLGRIDVDFAVATGGGPRPVWKLRPPGHGEGDDVLPSAMAALMTAVTSAWKERVDVNPRGNTDPVLDCLSRVIADQSAGLAGPYEAAMASAMRAACLWRLRKAYECCLHLVPMAEMEAVRDEVMARSVMES